MIRPFKADLHVHSLLSPCAAVEMTPRNIIYHAAERGLDLLAITDHNAGDNVAAALIAARESNITVLPGMEVETKEEAHFIVLFDKLRQLMAWEKIVDLHRAPLLNDADRFGAQFVVDAEDNLVAMKGEMLLAPLNLGAAELVYRVSQLGGIVIASHVDRPSYSIISQLGFIPLDLALAAVEVSRRVKPAEAASKYRAIGGLPVITASDAHTIDDFMTGPCTTFFMEQPTVAEIAMALQGLNSRKAVV